MYSLNIGKLEHIIRYPILISVAFLALLHISDGYIDCRISCRRCHENTEHPSVLEVYCAMCEECKQRRREKIQGKTVSPGDAVSVPVAIAAAKAATLTINATSAVATDQPPPAAVQPSLVSKKPHFGRTQRSKVARYGIENEEASEAQAPHHGYVMPGQPMLIPGPPIAYGYPGCPPLAYCSESEEEVTMRVTETTTCRTTTTTTRPITQPTTPCPKPPPCKRRKVHPAPVMAPMMMPMMPCMPCTNMCQMPCPSATDKAVPLTQPHQTSSATEVSKDYHYVFIGIPKNIL